MPLLVHHFFPHADHDAGHPAIAEQSLLTGGVACYRVYRTADERELAVGALELKFWQTFCDAAQLTELRTRHWSLGEEPGSVAARETIEIAWRHSCAPALFDAWIAAVRRHRRLRDAGFDPGRSTRPVRTPWHVRSVHRSGTARTWARLHSSELPAV
jgi:crotonobetainyl-CoA:carnitine CoA-transferase CaiB-like acyl-CoA transferase